MFSVVAAVLALVLVLAFKPTYKRLLAEHGNKQTTKEVNEGGKQLEEHIRLPKADDIEIPLTIRAET